MRKNILMFVFGAIVGSIGVGSLKAYEMGRYWKESEIRRVIYLLEKIAGER